MSQWLVNSVSATDEMIFVGFFSLLRPTLGPRATKHIDTQIHTVVGISLAQINLL